MTQVSKANIKKAKTRYYSSGSLGRDLYVSELSSLPLEDLKALHVEVKANLSFYKSELNTLAPEEVEKVKFQRFINTFFIKAIEAEVTQRRERDKKAAQMERVEREVFMRMLKGRFGSDAIDEIVRLSREVAKAQFPAEGLTPPQEGV